MPDIVKRFIDLSTRLRCAGISLPSLLPFAITEAERDALFEYGGLHKLMCSPLLPAERGTFCGVEWCVADSGDLRKENAELKSELSTLKSRHQHVLDHLDDAIVQLDELQEALEENAIVVVINVE